MLSERPLRQAVSKYVSRLVVATTWTWKWTWTCACDVHVDVVVHALVSECTTYKWQPSQHPHHVPHREP